MNKYLLLENPPLSKGVKVENIILVTNKGTILHTEWKSAREAEEFKRDIKELERLNKEIDKKLGL